MKILFFTDLHIGKKNANGYYLDLDLKVLDKVVKSVENNNIDKVVFGGDMFHHRVDSNQKALNVARKHLDILNGLPVPVVMILGNHDIYYNSSKEYNYYRNWDGLYDNIEFVYDIKEDGDFLYVGWLQNKKEIKRYESVSKNHKYIFGHFEFKNVRISSGYISKIGHDNINHESMIFSGHYHNRQLQKNLHYVGSPYPHDWHGKNSTQYGYCILNTSDNSVEYIDLNIMNYIEFTLGEYFKFVKKDYETKLPGNEIRLILDEQLTNKRLNEIKNNIYSYKPKNLIIEDNNVLQVSSDFDDSKIMMTSPNEFIEEYINNMDMDEFRKKRIMEKIDAILK